MKLDNQAYVDYKELEQRLLSWGLSSTRIGNLKRCNIFFGFYSIIEKKDIKQAKQHFNICGLLDAFRIQKYQDRIFDYDISSICYAMLSDNLPFVKDVFANLTYNSFYYSDDTGEKLPLSMEEMVADGENPIFVHTIQQFLKGNNLLIERNMELIEKKYFSLNPDNRESMSYDLRFFKALYEKNKTECEEVLKEMVSPKIHKMRNVDSLLRKYVSMPALGYAKLAWICGVEVEIKNKLIPKELLSIEPLDKYEIPYDFLK